MYSPRCTVCARVWRARVSPQDAILNAPWYNQSSASTGNRHTHPCFMGTMREVIEDCCGCCPPTTHTDAGTDSDGMEPWVSGALTWIVDNPGRQAIGSFHPTTESEWSAGALMAGDNAAFFAALCSEGVMAATAVVAGSGDVGVGSASLKDHNGRSLLHMAAVVDYEPLADVAIARGCALDACASDGSTPLHYARYATAVCPVLDAHRVSRHAHAHMRITLTQPSLLCCV